MRAQSIHPGCISVGLMRSRCQDKIRCARGLPGGTHEGLRQKEIRVAMPSDHYASLRLGENRRSKKDWVIPQRLKHEVIILLSHF